MSYKRSHPIAAERERTFHLSDSSGNPVTGATFATTDLQVAKPGASSYTNCNSAPADWTPKQEQPNAKSLPKK